MTLTIGPVEIPQVAVLAPMAGMTDAVFRRICVEQGCGLVYTELVKADCLLRGLRPSLRLVETSEAERPVGVQIFHHEPETLAEAARWVEEHVACDFIDLNMGCPVPKVVTKGAGAALMREPGLVERLVSAVVKAVRLPVTAKTRSGWDDASINAVEVARAIQGAGGQLIAVHARTRAQRHEGPVDWKLLAEVKNAVSIPVIGNGGIADPVGALAMRDTTGVDAVMVGRAALGNPWIFKAIDDAWNNRSYEPPTTEQRVRLVERHLREAMGANVRWATRRKDLDSAEERAMRYVRGHLIRYVHGAPGEEDFRRSLADLQSLEGVLVAIREAWLTPQRNDGGPTSGNPASAA
ncbi:MAG: tRNA dihydrouridine synthase DusB [Myxococcota bacterium]|nr:tRNA dihydrouridine synthase DusB [Myxococcota bacterium]